MERCEVGKDGKTGRRKDRKVGKTERQKRPEDRKTEKRKVGKTGRRKVGKNERPKVGKALRKFRIKENIFRTPGLTDFSDFYFLLPDYIAAWHRIF